jgi:hypothetical protein
MRIRRTFPAVVGILWAVNAAQASDLSAQCQLTPIEKERNACLCVVPIVLPVALVTDIEGTVLKSDTNGFSPVVEQASLSVGDRVLVGDSSKASLIAGLACQTAIGPDASLSVRQLNETCACLALQEQKPIAPAAPHSPYLAIAGAAGLLALGIHLLPVSP